VLARKTRVGGTRVIERNLNASSLGGKKRGERKEVAVDADLKLLVEREDNSFMEERRKSTSSPTDARYL